MASRTRFDWHFPLKTPHSGIPLGNGLAGLLVHGGGRCLKITLSRMDLWDHRGGFHWSERQNFAAIREIARRRDSNAMNELFAADTTPGAGTPGFPSMVPLGRIELHFPDEVSIRSGELDISTATAHLLLGSSEGKTFDLSVRLARFDDIFVLDFSPGLAFRLVLCPSFDLVPALAELSFPAPIRWEEPDSVGWMQPMPADPPCGVLVRRDGTRLYGVLARAPDLPALEARLRERLASCVGNDPDTLFCFRETLRDLAARFEQVPSVSLSNKRLDELYHLNRFRLENAVNAAHGVPLPLQGPWLEEYRLPMWSNDYHFNINVQMCYSPLYAMGRFAELRQLFDRILSWRETLRSNAAFFLGIPDGYMLPHAVDDRGTCMGGFWSGSVDHACTAWIAHMMFDYVSYSGDIDFLRDHAFEFMKGAFNVYFAMMERDADDALCFPLSVSPEYNGSQMNAWGRNASFQLAACHRLTLDLCAASEQLGLPPDPRWLDVETHLPAMTLFLEDGIPSIALWEGQDLAISHRHHSHLAGLYPFDTLDPHEPGFQKILSSTVRKWYFHGPALWSGWCIPWAAILNTRMGNPRMAELLLEIWERVFTNDGHASMHNPVFPGFSQMNLSSVFPPPHGEGLQEIMQLDGAFGVLCAIQDMLLHTAHGVLHIGAGVPEDWPRASFDGFYTPFGVRVSAEIQFGTVVSATFSALRDTSVRVMNPWPGSSVRLLVDGFPQEVSSSARHLVFSLYSGSIAQLLKLEPEKKD